uniref:Uncharacterized protein n=1 Tax=Chromera velia CCMP2878 TaxID=1169474 RepID=A0A0G4IAR1_9ALVE|eukprot:Cvel_12660.t1-p1 / transcript=Cvel_12660.t1 / gene=Cvel_12660 / organism=Chromera_velia_CCMP2878 / gene_product=hypothetical protein / transcript_product=hypothetical protein / location=Cvel_scaffold836:50951-53465(-) / protein_length=496 / sequence_SO=supercontig / SO=protein_coding / is_pseudo=false
MMDKVLSERLEAMQAEVAEKLRTKPDYRRMRRISCMDELVREINEDAVTFGLYSHKQDPCGRSFRRSITMGTPTMAISYPAESPPKSLLAIAVRDERDFDTDSDANSDASSDGVLEEPLVPGVWTCPADAFKHMTTGAEGFRQQQQQAGGMSSPKTSPTPTKLPSLPQSPCRPLSPRPSILEGGPRGGRKFSSRLSLEFAEEGDAMPFPGHSSPIIPPIVGTPTPSVPPSDPPSACPSQIRASRFSLRGSVASVGSGAAPPFPSPHAEKVTAEGGEAEGTDRFPAIAPGGLRRGTRGSVMTVGESSDCVSIHGSESKKSVTSTSGAPSSSAPSRRGTRGSVTIGESGDSPPSPRGTRRSMTVGHCASQQGEHHHESSGASRGRTPVRTLSEERTEPQECRSRTRDAQRKTAGEEEKQRGQQHATPSAAMRRSVPEDSRKTNVEEEKLLPAERTEGTGGKNLAARLRHLRTPVGDKYSWEALQLQQQNLGLLNSTCW